MASHRGLRLGHDSVRPSHSMGGDSGAPGTLLGTSRQMCLPHLTSVPPTAGSTFASPVSRPAIVHLGKRVLPETESEAPRVPQTLPPSFYLSNILHCAFLRKIVKMSTLLPVGVTLMAPGGRSDVATRWASFLGGHAVGSELRTQLFKFSRWRLQQWGPGSGSCVTRLQRRE